VDKIDTTLAVDVNTLKNKVPLFQVSMTNYDQRQWGYQFTKCNRWKDAGNFLFGCNFLAPAIRIIFFGNVLWIGKIFKTVVADNLDQVLASLKEDK
jgi:hypothetical protein